MKNFLLFLSLTAVFCVSAAMGRFDDVSQSWYVKNDHFSCMFLQGNMFPADFVFSNGKTPGIILFRDTATDSSGKPYALYEERWAETRVIRNDGKAFIIERIGGFFSNRSPVITPLKGVKVTCRYEFAKDSPAIRIKITYQKTSEVTCKINTGIRLSWYHANPFTNISAKGKTEKFVLSGAGKIRFWDARKQITLSGRDAEVTLRAPRVIAALSRDRNYPCSLNGGKWQYNWKKGGSFTSEAVLILKAK